MPLREQDFTPDLCQRLVDEHGSIVLAAQFIVSQCAGERGRAVKWRTVSAWISKHVGPRRMAREAMRGANHAMGVDLSRPSDPDRLNRIDDLLDRANVPLEAIGAIESTVLKAYGGFMRGPNGEVVKVPLYATSIKIAPPNPDFPVIQPAPTTAIAFVAPPRILRRTRTVPVISDIQAGFLRDTKTDALEPIHDPAALDVAYQIVADLAPDEIVFIGDVADLSPFSRWAQHPEYRGVTQASIDVVHNILGTFVSAAGARCTKRVIIGSNHDHRIEKGVLEWNKEALGVRRAGDIDGWPVFSLGYLARFDDLGLEWSGQYPGGEYYLLDDLAVMHAPPKAKEFQASVVHGHTHKLTRSTSVQHAHDGRKTRFVFDIGCLCRVGVTSDKFRLLVTNVPSDRGRTDWAQGLGIVNIVEAHGSFPAAHAVDQVSIIEGQAIYGGAAYRARQAEAT